MASTDTRTNQIFYKRAVFSQSPGKTLEDILRTALSSKSRWGERQENPTGDGQTFCFINHSGRHQHPSHRISLLGCELFSYVKGSDQSILNADPTAAEVDVSAIPPGKDREFLEGALYFGISRDHLAVMQSASLRFGHLERHLNWLLTRCAKVIVEENGVTLMDAVPESRGGAVGDVKGIKLFAPLHLTRKSLSALGAVSAVSTFFLGQTIGRFDKLIGFPLDSLQGEAFSRKLRKRRNRLLVKWWVGLVSGILAIALGSALKITKLSIIAGWAAAFIIISLVCFILIVVEFIALSHLLDQLKERADQQKKKQAFLTGSEA